MSSGRISGENGSLESSETLKAGRWAEELARAYQPVVSGFVLPAGILYVLVTIVHYLSDDPRDFPILGSLTAVTSIVCFGLYYWLRRTELTMAHLQRAVLLPIVLIYTIITTHQILHLEPPKLVYYVLLTMVIATAGMTPWIIVPGSLISLATAGWFAVYAGQEIVELLALVGLTGAVMAFGLARLLHSVIERQIRARLDADRLRFEAEYAAETDTLTGLPNRRRFFSHLSELYMRRPFKRLAIGILDLDGFKPVNDLHGHAFGDELLAAAASRVRSALDSEIIVARLGGDEFALLSESETNGRQLVQRAEAACRELARPFNIQNTVIRISASAGIAVRSRSEIDMNQLYERADYALYSAKKNREGCAVLFSAREELELLAMRDIGQELRTCDREKEMYVVFQPQVDAMTGATVGMEALARWNSPRLGPVAPDVFIREAERNGLISEITPLLLRKALAEVQHWPKHVSLSFNLSARDVVSHDTVENLLKEVTASGIEGRRIEFEITETSIMTDFDIVRASLKKLQRLGAKIALDDFGTGYANFSHIDELNIHKLKIDRDFVRRLGSGPGTVNVIKAMIDMCESMGLECVTEGVETEEELEKILSIGGRYIQGYLFSQPLESDQAHRYLEASCGESIARVS